MKLGYVKHSKLDLVLITPLALLQLQIEALDVVNMTRAICELIICG